MCGFVSRFLRLSNRLLPFRSGMTRRVSSSARTNPGASPFGETSQVPSAAEVEISRKGERPMNRRDSASRPLRSFSWARSLGVPGTIPRSSASVATTSLKGSMPNSSAGLQACRVECAFMRRSYILLAACSGRLAFAASGTAQSTERCKIRLTTVPMDAGMRNNVAGAGTGTGTLAGNQLTVDAAFDGLKSPATTAAVHGGRARGVRGESIGVLEVTKSTKGTVSGAINLADAQLKALRDGHLYIEVASEKAPEGNLWGWILK